MAIYFNENTFDSELLDTKNNGILLENFTYVVDELIKYVNAGVSNVHKKLPEIIGGQRMMVRAMRGSQLGYSYVTMAEKSIISTKGTKTIQAFGDDILVEEWTVSHGDVRDPELGERYPTHDTANGVQEPRGPYTCLLTARIGIKNGTATRCYLQCNCKAFDTMFYERLNKEGYTNPKSLPGSTGKMTQAPAMCKHLYAIYSKYYTNLVNGIEKYVINPSPILNAIPTGPVGPIPILPVIKRAKTQAEAIPLIIARLQQEFKRLGNDELAYFDTLSKKAGGGSYHLYIFHLVTIGQGHYILYRNKDKADQAFKTHSGPIQRLVVPDNPNIWNFFTSRSDFALLRSYIQTYAGPMPNRLKANVKKKIGIDVYMEKVNEPSDMIDSNILHSILELS